MGWQGEGSFASTLGFQKFRGVKNKRREFRFLFPPRWEDRASRQTDSTMENVGKPPRKCVCVCVCAGGGGAGAHAQNGLHRMVCIPWLIPSSETSIHLAEAQQIRRCKIMAG